MALPANSAVLFHTGSKIHEARTLVQRYREVQF